MIAIKNTQKKISVNIKQLRTDAEKILHLLRYPEYDLGILITTSATIRKYNRDYRGKDKPTDILSFAYHPELQAGKRIRPRSEEDKNLGDLIIAPEYVMKDSQWGALSLDDRLRKLLVHGICHLLGYDHENEHDWRCMRAKEGWLLKRL